MDAQAKEIKNKVMCESLQTWGQLHSNVIDYITITLQFS
jgi:hypothetical protein